MKNYKVYRQVLIAIAVNGGAFIHGISLGWSAPAGPLILNPNHDFVMTQNEFAWSVSSMSLGCTLSAVISGIIRNRFGTKFVILVFSFPSLLGWLSVLFAWRPAMIIIGRLLIGIAGGAYAFNAPVYIGEMGSKEIRGILLTLYTVCVKVGLVFAYTLGSFADLFTLNAVCGSMFIVYTVGFMFLPETPIFLVGKKEFEKAEKSIRFFRGDQYDAQLELVYLQKCQEEISMVPRSPIIKELKKRSTFKAFIIIISLFFFFQMSGINAVIFYTTQIFIEAGISMDPSLATIIIGVVQLLSTLSTIAFVDRFGRVFLLKLSFSVIIFSLIGVGSFFQLKAMEVSFIDELSWLPLSSLCLFCVGFSLGLGSVPIILIGELFSANAKRVIAPFGQTMSFVMAFFIGLLYPALVNSIGTGMTFFMFCGFCILGLLFTIFFIPETKEKSLMEIQTILKKK